MELLKRISLLGVCILVVSIATSVNTIALDPPLAAPPDAKTVMWQVDISHPYVHKGDYSEELVNIKLSGRKDVPPIARAPVNLVLVIDRSGSMSDRGKIDYA